MRDSGEVCHGQQNGLRAEGDLRLPMRLMAATIVVGLAAVQAWMPTGFNLRSATRTSQQLPVMTASGKPQIFKPEEVEKAGLGQLGVPNPGYQSLSEERDACGVGFIADQEGRRSHEVVSRTLRALGCMEHRGGCGGDSVSGDGAGVLTSLPWELFESEGWNKDKPTESCGVAMFFLPQGDDDRDVAMKAFETQAERQGLEFLGWRDVPQVRAARARGRVSASS